MSRCRSPLGSAQRRRRRAALPPAHKDANAEASSLIAQSWEDGVYMLVVGLLPSDKTLNVTYNVDMIVEMKSDYGYLSAGDYPKVHFRAKSYFYSGCPRLPISIHIQRKTV